MALNSLGAATCIWSQHMKVLPAYEAIQHLDNHRKLNITECDVILTTPNSALARQEIIQFGQSGFGVSNEDRCWTHVALVHRDGYIFEAVPKKGVQRILFSDFVRNSGDCHFRARRLIDPLTVDKAEKVLLFTSAREGEPYSTTKAALFGLANLVRANVNFKKLCNDANHQCASLVAASLIKGGVTVLENLPDSLPVPSTFSQSGLFHDIPIFK